MKKEIINKCEMINRSQQAVKDGLAYLNSIPPVPAGYNNPVEKIADPFDINSLRVSQPVFVEAQSKKIHLTPARVKKFVKRINTLKDSDKILVIGIGTGGTISMSPTGPGGTLEPDLNFDSILDKSDARLKEDFELMGLDAFAADSSQLEIDDVGDLAIALCYIWKEMRPRIKKRFAGFFIVHGTDTMPKSGNHLEMMLGKNMPFNVIHTGAQKTINVKINDAQRNVKEGLYALGMLHKNGCAESLTVMGGLALLTAGITKVSGHNAKAMDTMMHKYVIDFNELPDPDEFKLPNWLRKAPKGKKFDPVVYRGPNRTQEIIAEMQVDPRALVAMIRFSASKALLLVTYGANTYDVQAIRAIGAEAKKQNILAYAVSPVNAYPELNIYGPTEAMVKAHVTPLYMTKEAVRAKVMLAFAKFSSQKEINKFMITDFLGEIPNEHTKRNENGD